MLAREGGEVMATETGDGQALELVIQPRSEKYDPEDDRWREQMSDFFLSLDKEVGDVRREIVPVEGTKGGAASIILALGSAGAFTVTLDYFRAWLNRDKSRRLDISWSVGGQQETITASGDAIDQSTMKTLADAMAKRLGEVPSPTPATKPS